jgi:NADPH-dependent curcumin reductase CurA
MAPNLSLTFKKVPVGMPIAGQDIEVEDIGFDESTSPPSGGIMTENLYCSFDPYLRGRMRGTANKSYIGGFKEGEPVQSQTMAKVIKSDDPNIQVGSTIVGILPVQQYSILDAETIKGSRIMPLDMENGPKDPRDWLGALGMPGLTAYSSLYAIGKPKKGEVIFISSAAGAVGQIVGQLAKREGLRVIGSAGSDEKCKLCVEKLGFDECWNYKKMPATEALDKYCPDGEVYLLGCGNSLIVFRHRYLLRERGRRATRRSIGTHEQVREDRGLWYDLWIQRR